MRLARSPALLRILVLAGILVPAGAAGASTLGIASPERVAANSVTFQDSTGEDPQAPDITTVTVSNTDAGMVSFQIAIPNRPELTPDMAIEIFVDTDFNTATGSPDITGTDYVIELLQGEAQLFRWDGTNFSRRFGDPSAVTLSFSYARGVTIRISAAELGATKRFRFVTDVISGLIIDPVTGDIDGTNARADAAPGGGAGFYPFEVRTVAASLVVRKLTRSPARPVAGRTFSLRMTVARSDTGATLQSGRVTCVGRIGRSPLRATTARVVNRAVTCTWAIPNAAKGKSFRGSVTVVFEGLKASRSFSGKIG
jgi:hypothetical protein